MRIAVACAVTLLAGCATTPRQPEVPLEVRVQQVSNTDLCRAVFKAPAHVSAVAGSEAVRRGISCNDYLSLILQEDQARAAAAAAILSRPVPQNTYTPNPLAAPTLRPQTSCSSYRVGNTVQTDCR